nr:MAG TPA: hypothetical protein [Caudoviricetes sp.]
MQVLTFQSPFKVFTRWQPLYHLANNYTLVLRLMQQTYTLNSVNFSSDYTRLVQEY